MVKSKEYGPLGILLLKAVTWLALQLYLVQLGIYVVDGLMAHWQPMPKGTDADNVRYFLVGIPTLIIATFIWWHIWASWEWRRDHK